MSQVKATFVGLVAVFAVCMMASASASAFVKPLFLFDSSKPGFASSGFGAFGSATFETVGGTVVECKNDGGKGRLVAKAERNEMETFTLTFQNCEDRTAGVKCGNGGLGEIVTKALSGQLGYISTSPFKVVGLLLKPKSGSVFLEVKCPPSVEFKAEGTVICRVPEPYNIRVKEWDLICEQSKGKQEPREIEIESPVEGGKLKVEKAKLEGSFNGKVEEMGYGNEKEVFLPEEELEISA